MDESGLRTIWVNDGPPNGECYAAFRGRFSTGGETIHVDSGASGPYSLWRDGELCDEGPVRSIGTLSALSSVALTPGPGDHVVSVLCHHEGVETRLLPAGRPYLRVSVRREEAEPVSVTWRALRLAGYRTDVRRTNPELGWIDWCQTGRNRSGGRVRASLTAPGRQP